MKDLYNQTLEIGDAVAFNPPRYKGLARGKVVAFTPKMVTVEYATEGWCTVQKKRTTILEKHHCYPHDVAKVGVFALLTQK